MALYVTGTISRLYVSAEGCYITLSGMSPSVTPKEGYFLLKLTHANYAALYSLILSAAINRYKIGIRTLKTISTSSYPEITYILVDW